uniref:Ig-like domain-containing protein n=1 Tax=Dicentrarchus labrax TaxID=13489 RepID=A0A8C4HBG4_DICLA
CFYMVSVLCDEYKVEYQQGHICAVKGSTVVIPCSFHYPGNQIVDRVMWGHERHNIYDGPFIYESISNNTLPRFHYNGDKKHNCSLEISHVEPNDTGKYTFRFITDSAVGKWTGVEGSTLKVGGKTMNEGESVNLTCINSCDDLSSAFTWFKSGEPFSEGPVLYLSNMSSTNSGNYTCSLKSHTGTTSGVINIDVEYGPKNTSVSVRPSFEKDPSSNFTMICSSHANPPVENYTWFKIDKDDNKAVGHQPLFLSAERGQYFCTATNKHGSQNSSVVTLKIKGKLRYMLMIQLKVAVFTLYHYYISYTTTMRCFSEVCSCVFRLNKKRTTASEADREDDTEVALSYY